MNIEFTLPSDQHAVLHAFATDGRLRGAPAVSAIWTSSLRVYPGDRCPVFRQGNGTVWMTEAVWGHHDVGTGAFETTASPAGRQYAWPCLIPMAPHYAGSDGSGESQAERVRVRDEDWILVAGFWRPADRRNRESFVVLSRCADRAPADPTLHRVLKIDRQHWLDWIDPQKDNHWLHDKPWMKSFVVEGAPVSVARVG